MEVALEKPGKAHDLYRIFIPDINKSVYYIWKKPQPGELYYNAPGKRVANKIRKDIKSYIARYIAAFQKRDIEAMRRAVKEGGVVVIRPNKEDAIELFTAKELRSRKEQGSESVPTVSVGREEKYELRKAKERLKRWKDARRRKENLGVLDRSTITRRFGTDDIGVFIRRYLSRMKVHYDKRKFNPYISLEQVGALIPNISVSKGFLKLLAMDNNIIIDHLSPDGQLALAIVGLISSAALKAATE
jgi:hypothetical protein